MFSQLLGSAWSWISSKLSSLWQKVKLFWTTEWTKAWGWIKITVGTGWFALGQIIQDDAVKSSIPGLNLPNWVPFSLAILGVITLMSMSHKSPD